MRTKTPGMRYPLRISLLSSWPFSMEVSTLDQDYFTGFLLVLVVIVYRAHHTESRPLYRVCTGNQCSIVTGNSNELRKYSQIYYSTISLAVQPHIQVKASPRHCWGTPTALGVYRHESARERRAKHRQRWWRWGWTEK